MSFSREEIERNRRVFEDKLSAYLEKVALQHKLEGKPGYDFLLVDARSRDAYEREHITGAISIPFGEADVLSPRLPIDREIVTYCWSDY
jgi:rhodanese-related sulfurtransferase